MPPDYLWSDTEQINRYIQGRKVIVVGETRGEGNINFPEDAAKEYENEAVNDIYIQLSVMFDRPPSKASAQATISGGVLTGITVRDSGDGYTEAPTVVISGGGGTGATAEATIAGKVRSIRITNAGVGYTSAPTVEITGGGSTTPATATAEISDEEGNDPDRMVINVRISNPGSGYTSAPTVVISGGGGTGATAEAIISSNVNINLTNGGSGYTSGPTVTISGGVIPNPMLSRYAAKLTAAKIGAVYVGTSEGYVPNWILWYNNEVFASLFRLMLSVDYEVKAARSASPPANTTLIPRTLEGLSFRPNYAGIGLPDMLVLAKPRFTFIDRDAVQ